MKIEKNSLVKLAYILKYDDANGDIIENVSPENPLEITVGTEDLLEKFEEKILGLKKDDTFEFVLSPEDAYGNYDEEGIVGVPKTELLAETEDDVVILEGMIIPVVTDDGEEMEAVVLDIENEIVTLDFNHPLAGETLYFSGKIVEITN